MTSSNSSIQLAKVECSGLFTLVQRSCVPAAVSYTTTLQSATTVATDGSSRTAMGRAASLLNIPVKVWYMRMTWMDMLVPDEELLKTPWVLQSS